MYPCVCWLPFAEGFVIVTSTYSRIFFLCFHLIVVPLTMNIFISFIIEAFLLQLEYDASPIEDRLREKIKAEFDTSPMFREEFGRLEVRKPFSRSKRYTRLRAIPRSILPCGSIYAYSSQEVGCEWVEKGALEARFTDRVVLCVYTCL